MSGRGPRRHKSEPVRIWPNIANVTLLIVSAIFRHYLRGSKCGVKETLAGAILIESGSSAAPPPPPQPRRQPRDPAAPAPAQTAGTLHVSALPVHLDIALLYVQAIQTISPQPELAVDLTRR
ncbi:hypothetical protein JYU34_011627 [Plutella xylostella]|uniref:Uncharacterized protein n=1 Tax=Plutella xylostella TaxID=51655 RepID=A0ABQ7QD61_PLUXY|nr:hypothetical protein JYU34_011627 [Plutella xylostella]